MSGRLIAGVLLAVSLLVLGGAAAFLSTVGIPDPQGYFAQDPLLPGDVTHALTPETFIDARRQTRYASPASDAGSVSSTPDKQILFGDAHVHTTWSFDAFMFSLPVLNASRGALPPAAACDYARFVSQLDFFFLTDHAESYTAQRWRDAQDAVRHCNAVAGDPDNPDLVAFIGFEWSQFGRTPEDHYGHHNVLFRDIEQDRLPARPIGAAGPASNALRGNEPGGGGLGMLRWVDIGNRSYYQALTRFMEELQGEPSCPEEIDSRQLPSDCYESAATPGELYAKLDDWGFDTLVVPHGSTWGIYTPPGSSWDHQLTADNHDPEKGRLVEVYSGHGNSENFRDFSARVVDERGQSICPEPQPNYLPSCWQAGNIIRARCLKSGEAPAECEARAATARQHYVEVEHVGGWKSVPGASAEEWLDSGQARDVFLPAFNYRPGKSVQYGLARRNFDDPDNPIGYQWGLIASTDTHFARSGNGFKQYPRIGTGDAGMRGTRNEFWDRLIYRSNEEATARSREVVNIPGDDSEQERKMSFLTAGGVVAVHASGRDRQAIWDAMQRREVYGTSGHRMLLWFDLLGSEGKWLPMGSELSKRDTPHFRVTAVGAFKQLPGCPDYVREALSAKRLDKLAQGECYHPSDERYLIDRIEVVRISPQLAPDEPIADLVEDVWRSFPCNPDPTGCTVEFSDEEFPDSGRDAVYYVRAIEEPSPVVNGGNLRPQYDDQGSVTAVNPCYGDYRIGREDHCHASRGHRAWSSPIFLSYAPEG
jgi:hypothetical protein